MTTSQPTPPPTNATSASAERPQPRFAPGPLGRGVYLSDLVRWLMKKHEATRVQVVKDYLCPVLLKQCPQLGFVQASGDTTPVLEHEWHQTVSGYRQKFDGWRVLSRRIQYRDGNLTHVPGDPPEYTQSIGQGTDGAVKWLQNYWGCARNQDAVMENQRTLASCLAVTEADARRCWGWRSANEAAPAVDAVGKPADKVGDATNDEWWRAWCDKRNAANTNPDGTAKSGRARMTWEGKDVQVLGLRLSTLTGRGLADSAAKNAIAANLRMTTQGIGKQLEKLATLGAAANNQASQKVS